MKPRIFILVFAVLFCSACQPVKKPSQATLPTNPTTILPATKTPIPSQTIIPPTKLPTYTLPPPLPTISPLDIARTILTELSIEETNDYSPPNGFCKWQRIIAWPISEAAQLKYNNQYYTYVTLNCGGLDKPWVLVDKWTEAGLGYPLTSLLSWSVDGQYLYFYDQIIPDGCQPIGGFQQDLRQADLKTRAIQSFPITWTGGMTISPDSSKVIYYDRQVVDVGIYDLSEQQEQRISFDIPPGLESWFAGDFTWSPDGKSAIFIIEYGDGCFPSGASLRRVDPQANKIMTLLERENTDLSIIGWNEPNKVLISIDHEQQLLDPITGILSTP
jgi:hypothetical protein